MHNRVFLIIFCLYATVFSVAAYADDALNRKLLENAALGRAEDVAILLQKGASPNIQDPDYNTPLSFAIERQDQEGFEIVKVLVEAGAELNTPDTYGTNPLLLAIRTDQAIAVWYLLYRGANFYVRDAQGAQCVSAGGKHS